MIKGLQFLLIQLIMNFLKDEAKSWTTRQSDVNPNTIIESSFLEGFFRHLLADLHEGKISNIGQKMQNEEESGRYSKALLERLFEINVDINLSSIVQDISEHLKQKSPSFSGGQLNQLLQMNYSNSHIQYPTYKSNELLLVDVKIKADSERIGQIPIRMKEMLLSLQQMQQSLNPLSQRIKTSKEEFINFVVVYFGYYDFSLAKNTHFQDQQIQLFGRKYKLRINAIFVSKVALMETFKTFCKVPNLQEIDEMLIELYELRRAKSKLKRKRLCRAQSGSSKTLNCLQEMNSRNSRSMKDIGIKAMIGISAVGVAVALGKFFS